MSSVPPGAWLGLLGGGQLGRMFCMAAQSLGYKVVVLDPGSDSPAGSVADRHIRADYLDPNGLAELAAVARAQATTEFETCRPRRWNSWRAPRVAPTAASASPDRIGEKAFWRATGSRGALAVRSPSRRARHRLAGLLRPSSKRTRFG
jgi:5-(carboxyamino)imidazole ribonucleotide synthase